MLLLERCDKISLWPNMSSLVLAYDYIQWSLSQENIIWKCRLKLPPLNKPMIAMRELGSLFHKIYHCELTDMVTQLNLKNETTAYISFMHICDAYTLLCVPPNGDMCWGRIVALYAFGGIFATYCARNNLYHMIEHIVRWISIFTTVQYWLWIDRHGGWEGLVKFNLYRKQRYLTKRYGTLIFITLALFGGFVYGFHSLLQ